MHPGLPPSAEPAWNSAVHVVLWYIMCFALSRSWCSTTCLSCCTNTLYTLQCTQHQPWSHACMLGCAVRSSACASHAAVTHCACAHCMHCSIHRAHMRQSCTYMSILTWSVREVHPGRCFSSRGSRGLTETFKRGLFRCCCTATLKHPTGLLKALQ